MSKEFKSYVQGVLARLHSYNRVYRFITEGHLEPGMWIAYMGFDYSEADRPKLSTSISPLFPTVSLTVDETQALFRLSNLRGLDFNAFAVSYAPNKTRDEITYDHIYPYEMEIGIYRTGLGRVLDIQHIINARLGADFEYSVDEYLPHKSFVVTADPSHRAYARKNYTWIPVDLAAKVIALTALLYKTINLKTKEHITFNCAWDEYWYNHDMLECRYDEYVCRQAIERSPKPLKDTFVDTIYALDSYLYKSYFIPSRVWHKRFRKRVVEELEYIASLFNIRLPKGWDEVSEFSYRRIQPRETIRVSYVAWELYRKHPDVFESGEEAEKYLRSCPFKACLDEEAIRKYAEVKRQKKMGYTITPLQDPTVTYEE